MRDDSASADPLPFFPRGTYDHEMMRAGVPDPNAHWGRRYERTRDDLVDRFAGDGHQAQVWGYKASNQGGRFSFSLARCERCDYRTRIHRFPLPWARYKGDACIPLTAEELRVLASQKALRRARAAWLLGAVFSAVFAALYLLAFLFKETPTSSSDWVFLVVFLGVPVYAITHTIRRWNEL